MDQHRKSVSSDVITRAYLDSLLVEVRHIDAVMPSTELTLYGKTFRTPVMTAALSHLVYEEGSYFGAKRRYLAVGELLEVGGRIYSV